MAHQGGGNPPSAPSDIAQQGMGNQQSANAADNAPAVLSESVHQQTQGNDGRSASQSNFSGADPITATGGVLSSDSLEDFLINNNKFYGKKISIETNNLDVKEAIKFIAEESGANLLMDDGLEGRVSLRLRQVPWDQALVLILKAKKLGYVRQGNVLRIARLTDIQNEEAEAIKLLENRRSTEPLVVKRFLISYADIKELETKIKEFIASTVAVVPGAAGPVAGASSAPGAPAGGGMATPATLPPPAPRGKVISDVRTSSLIVTDTPDNIAKIEKLIAALDSQPRQVLIEGKVIEATEEFSRSIGVNWSSNPVKATTFNKAGLSITQALPTSGTMDSNFTWGRVDVLGDLTARLMLGERQDKVKTLSSPKITVLSNQPANISQAVSVQIKAGSTTVSNSAGSVITDQINTVPLGVFLKVTPQASNEGTVTLDMDIEKSTLVAVDSTSTNKRNAKSKVIVKSGQTAVIGGIFEATNTTGISGVPGLKDIPILGSLFRGQVEQNQKSELIIFVTPHILQPVTGDDKKSSSVLD
jgi:type IV pilus assembly protein PilQ